MTDDQRLGLAIILTLIAVPLLIAAVFLLPISLAAKLAIVGGGALVGAGFASAGLRARF